MDKWVKQDFPYTIKLEYALLLDNRCCGEVTDHTGFHFSRCPHPIKESIDGIGLCGHHARRVKKWRENK